jgi:hypothetical protein
MKQEYEAMLAGLPLLPPGEQQEFFDYVRSIQAKQIMDGCARIAATASDAPIDKRVARYVKLREARAASNKDATTLDQSFKEALEAIESSLIKDAQEQGVTGFKTEAGTTYLDERMLASVADENAFFGFVKDQGDLDFFERRVKVAHVKEWMEANEGRLPPGLNVFRELTMKVRRK